MIVFIIWLTGYILSYFLWRYGTRKYDGSYTKGDRVKSLCTSLFSWFKVIITIIMIIIASSDNKEEAKW